MLRPEELERLLCGLPEYDLMDLRQHVKYVNYEATDEIIQWYELSRFSVHLPSLTRLCARFWSIIEALPNSKRRKFLVYLTGSARVPVRGATDIRMVIQRTADEVRRCLSVASADSSSRGLTIAD